jgi:hypothetical protein
VSLRYWDCSLPVSNLPAPHFFDPIDAAGLDSLLASDPIAVTAGNNAITASLPAKVTDHFQLAFTNGRIVRYSVQPVRTFALKSYRHEAAQAQTDLERWETCQDSH